MKSLPDHQWNRNCAAHLLNRAGFGASPEDLDRITTLSHEQAVEELVNFPAKDGTIPPPSWLNEESKNRYLYKEYKNLPEEERRDKRQAWTRKQRSNLIELRAWWLHRMRFSPYPLQEKMTLFLHGHFATAQNKVQAAYPHYRQNELFREYATGSWKELTREIARDPAMLIYLDNARSNKRKPNENFARELMELFTLGEGNYTETDVSQAARAFTGWSLQGRTFDYQFYPRRHDGGEKTIFGKTGTFDGDDVIDLIFQKPAAADHLADHLIRFFISDRPNEELQKKLADVIRHENFELKPILRTLFLSEEFYRPEFRNNKIKSPVEWLIGMLIQLDTPMIMPIRSTNWLAMLGQKLFHPPNVKGWDGGFAWITASNLLSRYNFAGYLVHLNVRPGELNINLKRMGMMSDEMAPAMTMEDPAMMSGMAMNENSMMSTETTPSSSNKPAPMKWPYGSQPGTLVDAEKLIPTEKRNRLNYIEQELTSRLFPGGLRQEDKTKIHNLLDSLPAAGPWTHQDIKTLIHLMMSTPQYQVC